MYIIFVHFMAIVCLQYNNRFLSYHLLQVENYSKNPVEMYFVSWRMQFYFIYRNHGNTYALLYETVNFNNTAYWK